MLILGPEKCVEGKLCDRAKSYLKGPGRPSGGRKPQGGGRV